MKNHACFKYHNKPACIYFIPTRQLSSFKSLCNAFKYSSRSDDLGKNTALNYLNKQVFVKKTHINNKQSASIVKEEIKKGCNDLLTFI